MERFQRQTRNQRQTFAIGYAHDVLVLQPTKRSPARCNVFPSAEAAKSEYDRYVREKLEESWTLESGEIDQLPPEPSHLQFVSWIREHPEDEDAFRAYADWLQERNDPRGELIVLQSAIGEHSAFPLHEFETRRLTEERPELKSIVAAEVELLTRYPLRLGGLLSLAPQWQCYWRNGFAHRLYVGTINEASPLDLGQLLRHPGFQFLRTVSVSHGNALPTQRFGPGWRRGSDTPATQLLAALEEHAPPLQRLTVTASDNVEAFRPDLSWIWSRFPMLDSLRLQGTQPILGEGGENLRRLQLSPAFFSAEGLAWLMRANLANLAELTLSDYRSYRRGPHQNEPAVAEWMKRGRFPNLRVLRFDGLDG